MPMPDHIPPGPLSPATAAALAELSRQLQRVLALHAQAPLQLAKDAGPWLLSWTGGDFLARVDSGSGPFAFTEQRPDASGGTDDLLRGRTGTTGQNPLYEANGISLVPANAIVLAREHYLDGSTGRNYSFSWPSIQVGESDGSPTYSLITRLLFDATYFVVSQPGTNIAQVTLRTPGITVEEDDGSPTYADVRVLQVHAPSFVLSQPAAHTALITAHWGTDIQDVGTSTSNGTSETFARSNHVHGLNLSGSATVYRDDCVQGVVFRYRSTITASAHGITQSAWVYDSTQGCCDCGPIGSGGGTCCFWEWSGGEQVRVTPDILYVILDWSTHGTACVPATWDEGMQGYYFEFFDDCGFVIWGWVVCDNSQWDLDYSIRGYLYDPDFGIGFILTSDTAPTQQQFNEAPNTCDPLSVTVSIGEGGPTVTLVETACDPGDYTWDCGSGSGSGSGGPGPGPPIELTMIVYPNDCTCLASPEIVTLTRVTLVPLQYQGSYTNCGGTTNCTFENLGGGTWRLTLSGRMSGTVDEVAFSGDPLDWDTTALTVSGSGIVCNTVNVSVME